MSYDISRGCKEFKHFVVILKHEFQILNKSMRAKSLIMKIITRGSILKAHIKGALGYPTQWAYPANA
jgi:hypothetical protein